RRGCLVPGRHTAARTCQCSPSDLWPVSCSPAASTRAIYLMRFHTPPVWVTTRAVAPEIPRPATTQ
ncbi:unnamed protein product, partial [Heterotrigona itama]